MNYSSGILSSNVAAEKKQAIRDVRATLLSETRMSGPPALEFVQTFMNR